MIILLGGTFDLFHIGHLRILESAKKIAEKLNGILVVDVLTDEAVERYKRKPIIPFEQRCEIVKKFADIVVPSNDVDATPLLEMIKPDVLIHGSDALPHEMEWLKKHKTKLIILPYTKGISTTEIIKKINEENE